MSETHPEDSCRCGNHRPLSSQEQLDLAEALAVKLMRRGVDCRVDWVTRTQYWQVRMPLSLANDGQYVLATLVAGGRRWEVQTRGVRWIFEHGGVLEFPTSAVTLDELATSVERVRDQALASLGGEPSDLVVSPENQPLSAPVRGGGDSPGWWVPSLSSAAEALWADVPGDLKAQVIDLIDIPALDIENMFCDLGADDADEGKDPRPEYLVDLALAAAVRTLAGMRESLLEQYRQGYNETIEDRERFGE